MFPKNIPLKLFQTSWWAYLQLNVSSLRQIYFSQLHPRPLKLLLPPLPPHQLQLFIKVISDCYLGKNWKKKITCYFPKKKNNNCFKPTFWKWSWVYMVCIFFLGPSCPMRSVWLPYWKLASILVCELCSPFTPKMTFRLLFKVIFITLSQEGPNRWEAIFRAGLATDVLRKSLRHHLWKNIWRLFTRVNP